ncbi:YtxH domain-containing protein [Nitrospirota bacterium]
MSRQDGCGGGSVLFSFILGAIVGAGAAALFSPSTGAENRRKLSELGDEFMERTTDLREEANEQYGAAREKLDDSVARGKEFVDKQKGILSSAIEAGKEAYNRERESQPADES